MVAVVVDAAVGALWYSPLAFGDAWHALQGLDAAALTERTWVHGVSMLVNVLKMTCLALLISLAGVESWRGGLRIGVLAWAGFVLTIWTGSTLYADRSLSVLAINMGFHLVVFSVVSALMGRFVRPR
ncbi:MAG: DUF1761 domain-containing protein [Deltaproteobacteria bacterium]|nr:DUF1761 domain-containing protein [Deltaproteobacteria bacterium]